MIAAAEGLSRLAFGNQPLFWQSWSNKASNSIQIIGRTLSGYLLVGIEVAYVTFFYFLSLNYLGWWQPSQHLYDPNTLATYLPWLSPIASSLGAGFLEECLFRIIPLSLAALIGTKYKKRKLFVVIMFIIQALVFGAAHASYAAQPFYARMIELIIPSFNFALIFLYFGMLPAIISHFIYDVIWFSLPIFIAQTSGIWVDRSLIILLSALPLLPILFSLLKNKSISELPAQLYNHYWKPPVLKDEVSYKQSVQKSAKKLSPSTLIILAILGLCAWIYFSPFLIDTTPLTISRTQAIALAQKELEDTISINEWATVARLENPLDYRGKNSLYRQHLFSWQTGGSAVYKNLNGTFLLPPAWLVRFVKFSGTLEDRAEEYQVTVFDNGTIARIKHIIPEEQHLTTLSKEKALELIKTNKLILFEEPYSLVSAKEKKQLHRIDWITTYSTSTQELEDGQKRFRATVSGNLISDAYRYIFVPEQWQRTFNNEQQFHTILKSFISLILFLLLLIGFLFVFLRKKQHLSFSFKAAGIVGIILLTRSILQTINMWPQYISIFKTSEPYSHQVFSLLNSIAVTYIFKSLIFAALAGLVLASISLAKNHYHCLKRRLLAGTALGLLVSGINALLQWFGPHKIPTFPNLSTAGALLPSIGYALYIFQGCIEATLISLLFIWIAGKLDSSSIKQRAGVIILFIAMMMGFTIQSIETIQFSIMAGLILGFFVYVCYEYIVKADPAIVPIGIGIYYILLSIQHSILNFSYDTIPTIITVTIMISCWALWASNMIARDVNTVSPQERR